MCSATGSCVHAIATVVEFLLFVTWGPSNFPVPTVQPLLLSACKVRGANFFRTINLRSPATSSYQLLRHSYAALRAAMNPYKALQSPTLVLPASTRCYQLPTPLYELLRIAKLLLRGSTNCYELLRTTRNHYALLPAPTPVLRRSTSSYEPTLLRTPTPLYPSTTNHYEPLRAAMSSYAALRTPTLLLRRSTSCYAVATRAGYPAASSRLPAATECYAVAMEPYRRGTHSTILPSYRSLWSAPE
ncbi:hypothetical protein B0H17DRAFT_1150673 [Mycena rosella]|uniref:Uncharacterized protein n=1 Tax=Mycena rosella TaxID=1033263 RepID=A0AAD7BSC8_MYCRO|nr:hypothetical protein B0H17DRAFT_1150673 [Mycena rosella]